MAISTVPGTALKMVKAVEFGLTPSNTISALVAAVREAVAGGWTAPSACQCVDVWCASSASVG
jgi:hypothetical protein